MTAPFDYQDVSARAERLSDQLLDADSGFGPGWDDPPLGPLQRVYALLTYRPDVAFDDDQPLLRVVGPADVQRMKLTVTADVFGSRERLAASVPPRG